MNTSWTRCAVAIVGASIAASFAQAQLPDPVLITDFSFFTSNELYASWADPNTIIDSGENDYSITATGYGSNYKYIGALATGMTHLELEINLSGPPEAEGKLGPIISFVDADEPGTFWNWAFYGQTLGDHVLRAPLFVPTGITRPGATPGLNLDSIPHMHMQLDPSTFTGTYTVTWKNLQLYAAGPGDFDGNGVVDGADVMLWQKSRYAFNASYLNLNDFKTNFGKVTASAATAAVPEPATALLLLTGLAGLAAHRRR